MLVFNCLPVLISSIPDILLDKPFSVNSYVSALSKGLRRVYLSLIFSKKLKKNFRRNPSFENTWRYYKMEKF